MTIKDAPRFQYRGFMLDVSRNFISKQTVMQLMDVLSVYKMNVFHFHLTDDEGWRIEIPDLPELTSVCSFVIFIMFIVVHFPIVLKPPAL